ncbi:TetR/AcrR family transcriptional regulator [Flavobacterium jejuense]|uniref:TetR/AcrR family transcriptional regulator n=1 Tax=Flavobacterium jejuense TaxID=1544455 RepID=A0ABX0ITT9_9FLAO|nr:TetR/AcrR family transcriptional regulator [Flavobacterium jejuense]NHN27128.1 TetR/AcrR family transcriptional regulator [Flavobacterium jejuense]
MDRKDEILEKALDHFLKNGSKVITMDDIAHEFGLSKKTLYSLFENKEALLKEAVDLLWNNFLQDVNIIKNNEDNPLSKIISIYTIAIQNISTINPIFLFSLKKYHHDAMGVYENYKVFMFEKVVNPLLEEARDQKLIRANIDIDFFHKINFEDIDEKLWKYKIFEKYSIQEAIDYFIILKLKGIITKDNFDFI